MDLVLGRMYIQDQAEDIFDLMARALRNQLAQPDINRLSFLERLTLLLDCEASDRENRALNLRLHRAKLHQVACMEDIEPARSGLL